MYTPYPLSLRVTVTRTMIGVVDCNISRDKSFCLSISIIEELSFMQVTSVGGRCVTLKLRVKTGGVTSLVEIRENCNGSEGTSGSTAIKRHKR